METIQKILLVITIIGAINWGLIGIWTGLAVGRMIASILNFIYARYTINKIRKEFATN